MYVITYSLRGNQVDSDEYYNNVAIFADQVLSRAEDFFAHSIDPIVEFYSKEEEFAKEYAILDLLILGVLWKVYSGDAMGLDEIPGDMLRLLSNVRNNNDKLKPGIDFLRGIMSTVFLSPDLYDNIASIEPCMGNFDKLVSWLKATGEFNQEVKRLEGLKEYIKTLEAKDAVDLIASAITFALWFENSSEENIGEYTENVERYLNELRPKRYWHEDVIFCGRRRVEYHLNMVGAEIMNRAFKGAFIKVGKKLLLLPACMRLHPASKCKAKETEAGIMCARCSADCQVNQLTKLGSECNFGVVIVPHESSISAAVPGESVFGSDTGVIGVACVLNLISGGLKLKEMGVPAQCVLLDYCGCKNHWHDEGMPTCINVGKLKEILDI
ncbi:DUF116 domain-containing protein [Acetivibrio cellulolyticus]|uniref:DUF116 domain-containing protein n=1 Tax=Acetivibrio cellulolyticus TaxID=35830 RepID=UPI0001E2F60C|nr:DUF116 domain-containing protein [Acetivibrio cellulolyticus]